MHLKLFAAVFVATFGAALATADAVAAAPAQIGNPKQGNHDFAVCSTCHQMGPNAKSGVGPVLNGIVGRKAASYPGYGYSPANKNSGREWLATPELVG